MQALEAHDLREPAAAEAAKRARLLQPRHVAVIMDGNGRWAKSRGLPRSEGHRRGVEAVRRTVRAAINHGIPFLTVYGFSAENWSRPPEEVSDLMGLLKFFVRHDLADLHRNNVRIRIIGERECLARDLREVLAEAEARTCRNTGLTLVVAFNYGARQEIAAAARRMAEAVRSGKLDPGSITVESFGLYLETTDIPDPDLLIRTSGEQRLSNFLLWQAAYAELVFVPVLWPDFDEPAFEAAVSEFSRRQRRFGGVSAAAP